MDGRLTGRILRMLSEGFRKLTLKQVEDPRSRHWNKKWPLDMLLKGLLAGLCTAARSLADVERLTEEMSRAARQALGLWGRLPDTTLRDLVVKLSPDSLRALLQRQVKRAHRQKALKPRGLRFGAVAVDGNGTAIGAWSKGYAQNQEHGGSASGASGVVRTMTCTLLSDRANVCIDAVPIPPETNEDGHFKTVLGGLLDSYAGIDLFRLVVADAGSCSLSNADFVKDQRLHYLFSLNEKQPTLFEEAQRLLGSKDGSEAALQTSEWVGSTCIRRTLFVSTEMGGYLDWTHLRTVLRIRREELDADGKLVRTGNRYFLSSLRREAFSDRQWLEVVRRYWASVESGCHQVADVALQEDKRPWLTKDDQGMLAILLLRRVAYNMLALFRRVTQRSEERRRVPWADLMRWAYNALMIATERHVHPPPAYGRIAIPTG